MTSRLRAPSAASRQRAPSAWLTAAAATSFGAALAWFSGCGQTVSLLDGLPSAGASGAAASGGPGGSGGSGGAAGQVFPGGNGGEGGGPEGQGGGLSGAGGEGEGGASGSSGGAGGSSGGGVGGEGGSSGNQAGGDGGSGGGPPACSSGCNAFTQCGDDGACHCKAGLTACGAPCYDLQSSAAHCGDCTTKCDKRQACIGGSCACRPGSTLCDGECVELSNDVDNCGACGTVCPDKSVCIQLPGQAPSCTMAGCQPPLKICKGKKGQSLCVDTATDNEHCGDCAVECDSTEACVGGVCSPIAPASPCTACPCDEVCKARFPDGAVCCPSTVGPPLCLASSSGCPLYL